MFKNPLFLKNDSINDKILSNDIDNIILNVFCIKCTSNLLNYESVKEYFMIENFLDNININELNIEFIPIKMTKSYRKRRNWSIKHFKVLEICLKLFGKNLSKIKIFFNKFSKSYLEKKIELYKRKFAKSKSFWNQYSETQKQNMKTNKEKKIQNEKNKDFKFSLDNSILKNKFESNIFNDISKDNYNSKMSINDDIQNNNKDLFDDVNIDGYENNNKLNKPITINSISFNNLEDNYENMFNY